jgi:uncharacterized protein (TIGR04255 family)
MNKTPSKFHYPLEIKLESSPLLEAWLEIRWKLEPGATPDFKKDPGFPFALGVFFKAIQNEFGYREDLPASQAPEEMLPHKVRHRFRPGEDRWPLLQLGPGVATVNFTDPYTWNDFYERALYLRKNLLEAYGKTELRTQLAALRYRNGMVFDYGANNLLDFLDQNLNTSIMLPSHIPGPVSSITWPISADIALRFDIEEPKGMGILRFVSGTRSRKDPDTDQETTDSMLMWQLEVLSRDNDAPEINGENQFAQWLTSAHMVAHEWFFSLIDSNLLKKFKGEEE